MFYLRDDDDDMSCALQARAQALTIYPWNKSIVPRLVVRTECARAIAVAAAPPSISSPLAASVRASALGARAHRFHYIHT